MSQIEISFLKFINTILALKYEENTFVTEISDVVDDKEILIAVFDEEEETLEETAGAKQAPFNHPRLAGDASLGLSPINPNTQRLSHPIF